MAGRLTKKEMGFVKDYLETGNGTQAALKNYDTESENTAAAIASENLRKPKIQKLIEEKLPDDVLFEIHREGLYASKPFFNEDGEKIAEEADYSVRHKYLDTAYKLKGAYAPDKHVNVNLDVESADPALEEITNQLNELLKRTGGRSDGGTTSALGTQAQDKE